MSRIEKGIFDKFFNGFLLKKRRIAKPFKYNIEPTVELGRYSIYNADSGT